MGGGCLASRDAQSEGRSRDEDGSRCVAGMGQWEAARAVNNHRQWGSEDTAGILDAC